MVSVFTNLSIAYMANLALLMSDSTRLVLPFPFLESIFTLPKNAIKNIHIFGILR